MTQIQRRQLWTAMHRYCGFVTMAFLLIASVTGVALSFTDALDAALNRDLFLRDEEMPLEPLTAVKALARARPDLVVTTMPVVGVSHRTLQLGVAARPGGRPLGYDQLFIDDNDGHVRGTRQSGPGVDRRHLMEGVFELHSTLLAGTWGRWLMGLVALGWLVGNFVGVYLTLPLRGDFWKQWKKVWRFKLSSPLPRLLLDLHRSSALWLLGGVSVIAFTSVCMNFFEEAFSPTVQALSPARPSLFDKAAPTITPSISRVDLARALAIAAAAGRDLGWRPAKVSYLPAWGVYSVMFTDNGIENYHRLGPVSLDIDGTTGRVVGRDDPYSDSAGRKLSRALYPLHTGKMIGRTGIGLDIVAGLATIEMIATGLYLWLKRRRTRVALRRAKRVRRFARM
jgi:uncharacterized iron-regulated membrane protein